MKNFKDIVIGFLLATCMFLLMGQTSIADKRVIVGKYQGFASNKYEIYRINTITGELEQKIIEKNNKNEIGWKRLP